MDTTLLDTGLLVARVVVGLYVSAHGAQKLAGWFDGPGLRTTISGMGGGLGFRPAWLWITMLSASEAVGGLLMALGLLGPLGPIAVAAAMLGATAFAHWAKGPWMANGGYELTATTLAVGAAVAVRGAGRAT